MNLINFLVAKERQKEILQDSACRQFEEELHRNRRWIWSNIGFLLP
jgi:hypothetical protein